jgi:hypothetical protein
VVGWIICAVLLFLMGGIPLIPGLAGLSRAVLGKPSPAPAGLRGMLTPGALKATVSAVSAMRKLRRSPEWQSLVTDASPASWTEEGPGSTTATDGPSVSDSLVGELERLDTLHRSGALSDEEYQDAKREVLGREGSA